MEVRWAGEPDVVMQLSGIPGAAVAVRTCQVRVAWAGGWAQAAGLLGHLVAACAARCAVPQAVLTCCPPLITLPALPCPAPRGVCHQVAGMLRVVLSPIEAELPFLTGVTLSLIERPYLDFDVR